MMPLSATLSIAELWLPWRWPARLIVASFAITQVLLATSFMTTSESVGWSMLSIVLLAGAFVLLTLNWGPILPRRVAISVLGLVVAVTCIEAPTMFVDEALNSDWHLGALVGVLLATMLWGRVLCAWIGYALLAAIQITVSSYEGIGLQLTAPILLRHGATLAVAGFVVFSMRRVAEALNENAQARQVRDTEEAVRAVLADVRVDQFDHLDRLAGDLLRRIASGVPLTDAEREQCLLAEADLRDGLSGYALATPEVRAATHEARTRGIRVTLIDDSAGQNPHAELAAAELVRVLATLEQGSCMARLLPSDRDAVASIVVEETPGEARVIEVRVDSPSGIIG